MHSAKKWAMMHPDYTEGDGELLWNIYYGDLANDERFDAFRDAQMWDADVIRPMLEMDDKYARFQRKNMQLSHQVINAPQVGKSASHNSFGWLMLIAAALVIGGAIGLWLKQKESIIKAFDPVESQSLIADRREQYVF